MIESPSQRKTNFLTNQAAREEHFNIRPQDSGNSGSPRQSRTSGEMPLSVTVVLMPYVQSIFSV